MFERDFIKRMIQQFAQVVAKIIYYKSRKDWEQMQMVIDVALKQLLNINPDMLEHLTEDDLINLFRYDENIDHEKCLILGHLLYEQGQIYDNTISDAHKIIRAYRHSLALLNMALQGPEFNTKENQSIALACCDQLERFASDAETGQSVFNFYKQLSLFSRAEDTLYTLMQIDPSKHHALAISFYNDLLTLDDGVLEEGNLPRDEVLEGLRKLTVKL